MTKGKLVQFRRGRHTVKERQYLVELASRSSNDRNNAEKYVGSSVQWQSPTGKIIKGEISAPHGNKGILRARFEKGLPGQAIGSEVTIEENKSSDSREEKKEK